MLPLLVVAYLVAAAVPFRWQPPRLLANGVEITHSGQLRFAAPGLARTAAPAEWLESAIRNHVFELCLRVQPLRTDQLGPARIFSVSRGWDLRNLTVGQDGSDLIVRLRTPRTTLNGTPALRIPRVFQTTAWHDIDLKVDGQAVIVSVDGVSVLRQRLPEKPLRGWNRGFRVVLGNELSGARAWLGEISRATVSTADGHWDYLEPEVLEIPRRYWSGLRLEALDPLSEFWYHRDLAGDVLVNILGFVPLGLAAVFCWSGRWAVLASGGVCALVSFTMEASQLCFAGRFPSLWDFVANVLGGAAGVAVGAGLLRARRSRVNPSVGTRRAGK